MHVNAKMVLMVRSSTAKLKRRLCNWLAIWFLAQFAFVVSQNINFTFPDFENSDNLTLLGDAVPYYSVMSLNLAGSASSASQSPTCGKMMFEDKVRVLHADPSNATTVASFSTAFTFSIAVTTVYGSSTLANNAKCGGGGDGLVFVFSADNITLGDPGGCMCTI